VSANCKEFRRKWYLPTPDAMKAFFGMSEKRKNDVLFRRTGLPTEIRTGRFPNKIQTAKK
jgi:hypothetical protein